MSDDRLQKWKIVAEFGSLTRQANSAAKALRNLDSARKEVAANDKESTGIFDREASSLDKLSQQLLAAKEARKRFNTETRNSNKAMSSHNKVLDNQSSKMIDLEYLTRDFVNAQKRNAAAQKEYTRNIRETSTEMRWLSAANRDAARSSATVAKSVNQSTKVSKDNSANMRAASMRASALAGNVRRLSSPLTRASRLLADVGYQSKSWGLAMKMIPLTSVTSGINTLLPSIASLGGALGGLVGTLGPVINLLGAVPAMAAGAAGGFGSVLGAVTTIGGAYKKYQDMVKAQDKVVGSSAASSKKSAEAHAKQVRTATRAVENARKAQAKAARDVKDAERDLADTARENARRVIDAERRVADAQKSVRRAQEDVTRARKEATRALQDYSSELKGAALDEEDAVLSLEEARVRLAHLLKDPKASSLDLRGADLSVRQAEYRLEQIRKANKELREEAAEARRKGVEGSDLVVAAREAEAQAVLGLKEAQQGLNDTHADNKRSMEDAQRSLQDAKEAYVESGERVKELQSDLSDLKGSYESTAAGASTAAAKAREFDEAMAKLGPRTREVVKKLISMEDQFSQFGKVSAEAAAPGFLKALEDAEKTLFPLVLNYLEKMAAGAGRFTGNLTGLLTSSKSIDSLIRLFMDGEYFMEGMGQSVLNLIDWLLDLGTAAYRSGLTRWLTDVVEGWTAGLAAAMDTEEGMNKAIKRMKDGRKYTILWFNALKGVGGALHAFFRGMMPLGEDLLISLTKLTSGWEAYLESPSGEKHLRVWRELAKINLSGMANTIAAVVRQGQKLFGSIDEMKETSSAVTQVWEAITGDPYKGKKGIIDYLGDLLGIVTEDMILTILRLAESVVKLLKSFGESGGMATLIFTIDKFSDLLEIFSTLLDVVPMLSEAVVLLGAAFASKNFLTAIGNMSGINSINASIGAAKSMGYAKGNLTKATLAHMFGYGNLLSGPGAIQPNSSRPRNLAPVGIMGADNLAYQQWARQNVSLAFDPKTAIKDSDRLKGNVADLNTWKTTKATMDNMGQMKKMQSEISTRTAALTTAMNTQRAAQQAVTSEVIKTTDAVSSTGKNTSRVTTVTRGLGKAWGMVGGAIKGTAILLVISGAISLIEKFIAASKQAVPTLDEASSVAKEAFSGVTSGLKSSEEATKKFESTMVNAFSKIRASGESEYASQLARAGMLEQANKRAVDGVHDLGSAFEKFVTSRSKGFWNVLSEFASGTLGELEAITSAFHGLDSQLNEMSFEDAADSFKMLEQYIKDSEMSMEDIKEAFPEYYKRVYEAASAHGLLADTTAGSAEQEKLLYDLMMGTNSALVSNEKATKEAENATSSFNDTKKKSIDNWKSEQEAIRNWKSTLDGALGSIQDAAASQDDLAISMQRTRDSIAEMTGGEKTVVGAGAAAAENRNMFRELIQDLNDTTAAMEKQGAGSEKIVAYHQAQREELIKLAEQMDLGDQTASEFLETLGLLSKPHQGSLAILYSDSGIMPGTLESIQRMLKEIDDEEFTAKVIALLDQGSVDEALRLIGSALNVSFTVPVNIGGVKGIATTDSKGNASQIYFPSSGLTQKATGGPISGPGTATSDSIPALLSDGEYVIKTRSVRGVGQHTLDYINKYGKLPRFATGGIVRPQKFASGGGVSSVPLVKQADAVRGIFNGLSTSLGRWGTGVLNWWSNLWNTVNRLTARSMTGILGTVGTGMSKTGSNVTNGMGGVLNSFRTKWSEILTTVSGRSRDVESTIRTSMGRNRTEVSTGNTNILNNTRTSLGTLLTNVGSRLTELVGNVRNRRGSFQGSWEHLFGGMQSPVKRGIDFLNKGIGAAISSLASFFGGKNSKKTPFPLKNDVGYSEGGWTGPGSKYQPAGVVHADEFVVQKSARRRIERTNPGYLDYMNRTGRIPGYANGGRVIPTSGRLSGNYSGHSGIDYATPVGTPVLAADSGVITSVRSMAGSFGKHIIMAFNDGMRGVYAHLSGFNVKIGEPVSKGQVIGRTGNTGRSTGPHLHFEVSRGSFGHASNRPLTQKWLGGAVSGGSGFLGGLPGLEELEEFISGSGKKVTEFVSEMKTSGFGSLIGDVVVGTAKKVAEGAKSMFAGMFGDLVGSGLGAPGDFGTGSKRANAFGIIDIAMKRGLGHRGALLGLMAAMQESSLVNLAGGDRDSVGLFQQRPSMGWGSVQQIMNPSYSTNKFFDALVRKGGWQTGPEWEDIQRVQVSAFPYAYQKHKGAALALINEWQKSKGVRGGSSGGSKSGSWATGGWTGPGSKYQPAGIVHADEYVINKASRRKIETQAPGYLDYLNKKGSLPGYASGGKVAYPGRSAFRLGKSHPAVTTLGKWLVAAGFGKHYRVGPGPVFTMADLRNVRDYQRSQGWRGSDADGYPGPTSWSRLSKLPAVQKLTAAAATQAAKKVSTSTAKPSALDVVIASLESQNKQMGEFYGYLNTLRGKGLINLFDHLRDLGPNGIPEEFRDSENPVTGIELAKSLVKNVSNARRYEEALKRSAKFGGEVDNLTKKMEEMVTILAWGTGGPYGLQAVARELGVSLDTASMLFKRVNSSGMLKSVASSRTSRIRGDVAGFDNLFRFARGGIVPGSGNVDNVPALLTPGELVVPKDVVQSMFGTASVPSGDYTSVIRSVGYDTSGTGGSSTTYNFNTSVYNPVAEESSMSVQKRVKSVASLGLLGGRRGN